MFLLTASAHWGKRRPNLIKMVPAVFNRPDVLVSLTGVLEILGAVGLMIPAVARTAAAGLALLLVAVFPETFMQLESVSRSEAGKWRAWLRERPCN